jgi:hypothetical protein
MPPKPNTPVPPAAPTPEVPEEAPAVSVGEALKNQPAPGNPKPTATILVEDLSKLIEIVESQKKDMAVMKDALNRDKLLRSEAKHGVNQEDLRPRATLKVYDNKVIVKWKDAIESEHVFKNQVVYNGITPIGEIVKSHLVTIDGEEIITDYSDFIKRNVYTNIRRLSQSDTDGKTFWRAVFEDPNLAEKYGEIDIETKFLNCP